MIILLLNSLALGTGEDGEVILWEATHVTVESTTFVRSRPFFRHPNIVEVICHEDVEKIEREAFFQCISLRRAIMPGMKLLRLMHSIVVQP